MDFDKSLRWIAYEEHGQGLTEYALVVVLVGVAVAGVVEVFAGGVGRILLRVVDQVSHI